MPGRVALIDGRELAELMIDHGVGVSATGRTYELKRIDEDYFADEEPSALEPAVRGAGN